MASIRHMLSLRDVKNPQYPRALPEESRAMVKAKMEAMGYPVTPPAVPEKERTKKQSQGDPLKSARYSKDDGGYRRNVQSQEYDRSDYTSIYEERMSQDISSALSNHLAIRPRDPTDETKMHSKQEQYESRRRSRSADGVSDWHSKHAQGPTQRLPRGDSRSTSQPPDHQGRPSHEKAESNLLQTLNDRQRTPQINTGQFEPLSKIGHSKTQDGHQKSDATNSSPRNQNGPSPTSSIGSDTKHTLPVHPPTTTTHHAPSTSNRKRSRDDDDADLDYTRPQLAAKTYADLASESFDHHPETFFATNPLIKRLPAADLPLSSQLQALYDTTANANITRGGLARTFFATLPIDRYEECGDLLAERFADVMLRLREARQVKRKAARALEEEVRQREAWVRRKRACVEQGLDRLRTTGMSVVRPVGGR